MLTLLAVCLPFVAVFVANYHLLFTVPKMEIVEKPEIKMVYIDRLGSYVKTSTFMLEVYQTTKKHNIECAELMGQFFDNAMIPEEQRRARYACVVKEFPKEVPDGFKVGVIPASAYVATMRDETGSLVALAQATRMTRFARQNNYSPAGYFLEFYTPGRLRVQQAETLQAVNKLDIGD